MAQALSLDFEIPETCITCIIPPIIMQLHYQEHLYKQGRGCTFTKGSLVCVQSLFLQWNRSSKLKGFRISYLEICIPTHRHILELQYCFHVAKYSVSLSIDQEVSTKYDFCSRFLSAGIFLEAEVSLSADSPCEKEAKSITCTSCISGKTQRQTISESVDTPKESLLLCTIKRLILCSQQKCVDC